MSWQKDFDKKFLDKENKNTTVAYPDIGWAIKQFIKDLLSEIETDILVLKANIPLTQGKYARKLARELLAKIE